MMSERNFLVGMLCLIAASSWSIQHIGATILKQAAVGELFTYKIEPQLFNWSHQIVNEQYRYRPSLRGYPDLPSWMRYNNGYFYGTPPEALAGRTIDLDIVCMNRQNYETRTAHIAIFIAQKFMYTNVVQMKIDNLNWVHLMDPGRVENLLNIFRKELWPESERDLTLVFLESALNMGGRLPLRPQQREGVIVHLGSFAQFSPRLRELQDEVRPLYKLTSCTYKRTSVQKIFENAGFKLDWCAFKTTGAEITPEILFHNHAFKGNGGGGSGAHLEAAKRANHNRWHGSFYRDEVPSRNYIDEFAFAFAIPGMIFAILIGMLSAILCFHHRKLRDPSSEIFFQNIFHTCEKKLQTLLERRQSMESTPYVVTNSSTVQVQCDSNTDQPITTLKSLKDPNLYLDNASMNSQCPSTSFYPNESPSNSYLRPKPPPYKGNTLPRNGGVDI